MKKIKVWGLGMAIVSVYLLGHSLSSLAATNTAGKMHIGTFEGSTTFTTSSSNGINPGLFLEVRDADGNKKQYTSEDGMITVPNTKEGAYVTQAKLLGKTKYRDQDTGELLDEWEDGRNLELESVQMPVLTTTGKNLFEGELLSGKDIGDGNGVVYDRTNHTITSKFAVPKNKKYKVSSDRTLSYCIAHYYKNDDTWLGRDLIYNKSNNDRNVLDTSLYDYDYLRLEMDEEGYSYLQIEEGTTATPYEPNKSNILSASEDVTLRGIGDVRDELDLLTGEFVEKTKELELNTAYNVFSYNHSTIPDTHLGFSCDIENNEVFSTIGNYVITTSNYDLNLLAWSSATHIYGQINKSLLKSYDTTGLIDFFSNNEVSVIVRKAKSTVKTVDLNSTYQFNLISDSVIQVKGDILPTIYSITVPSEPLTFAINPNAEEGQQFIAPEFRITNDSPGPVRLELKSFTQTTNILNDVLPDAHSDWTQLNLAQSRDIALALVPKPSDGWLTLNEGEKYVANTSNTLLGEIKRKGTVDFSFSAFHGGVFDQNLFPEYRLVFTFGF